MGIKLQKLIVAFVAGLIAVGSGIALTHVGRADRTAAEVSDATPTIGEGRNLTREILRSRREHGKAMAELIRIRRWVSVARMTKEPEPVAKETTKEAIAAKEPKDHSAAKDAPKPKSTTVAAVALPRSRPDAASEPAMSDPAAQRARRPAGTAAQFRLDGVLSVSDLSGKAANLTGDTARTS